MCEYTHPLGSWDAIVEERTTGIRIRSAKSVKYQGSRVCRMRNRVSVSYGLAVPFSRNLGLPSAFFAKCLNKKFKPLPMPFAMAEDSLSIPKSGEHYFSHRRIFLEFLWSFFMLHFPDNWSLFRTLCLVSKSLVTGYSLLKKFITFLFITTQES